MKINSFVFVRTALLMLLASVANQAVSQQRCHDTGWLAKDMAGTPNIGACPSGYVVSGIGFKHFSGQDLAYQEKFKLYCCPAPNIASGQYCIDEPWISKHPAAPLIAMADVTNGQYLAGINFYHESGQDLAYQERFQLYTCRSHQPSYLRYQSCNMRHWQPKDDLVKIDKCPDNSHVTGIRFQHESGKDYSYQEAFALVCCSTP